MRYPLWRTFRQSDGFTLQELLIVIAIFGIVAVSALFNWRMQLQKGFDARRKGDLDRIAKTFEDYYTDNGCYPDEGTLENCGSEELASWGLPKIPCDPEGGLPYSYQPVLDAASQPCSGFRVFTLLKNPNDQDSGRLCPDGCADPYYNYGVSSGVAVGSYTSSEPSVTYYACRPSGEEIKCNVVSGTQCDEPGYRTTNEATCVYHCEGTGDMPVCYVD